MKQVLWIISLLAWQTTVQAQSVSIQDFKDLDGSWSGTLTYLDYTSNTNESIPATLQATVNSGNNQFIFRIGYPGEKSKGGSDTYAISNTGQLINDMKVIEHSKKGNSTTRIVLEGKGIDGNDNKPATFHYILEFNKKDFTISKMVKFDGTADFFRRNQYVLHR